MILRALWESVLQNMSSSATPALQPPNYTVGTGPACGQGYELILQGFNWESCHGVNGAVWYEHMQVRLATPTPCL